MARRMLTNNKCPLCGDYVKQIPDSVLKQRPHEDGVELVVTKRGLKQYFHSACWYDMIKEKRPYNGKMYV